MGHGRHADTAQIARDGLPPAAITTLQVQVEDYIQGLVVSHERATARLVEAMRYSLLAGGKRIRPVLALATAEALGRPPESVLPLAAALEMIHTHSLIHDDLPAMDDDDLRRGKPTAHVAFGEDVALLAGDALLAEAFTLALRRQDGEPANVLAAVAELAQAAGVTGLIGGQYVDVSAAPDLDERALRRLHELKTGRLLAAAVGTVLSLTGESGPAATALRSFASEVGLLFQIVDDILDVTADEAVLGKPPGSDARGAKRTYVSAFGLDEARRLARQSHAHARAALTAAPGDTSTLEQIADYILERHS
jgi:geranylgeranyl diphosphate synthase type II